MATTTPPINYTIKAVLLGSVSVGKTSLCHYLVHKQALTHASPTVGGAHYQFDLPLLTQNDRYSFTCQLWDTAGSERYASMIGVYLRSAQVALVVCDVKEDDSIIEVERSLEHLKNIAPSFSSSSNYGDNELECQPIFILNKCDLATDQAIDKQERILRSVIQKSLPNIQDENIIVIKTCGLNGVGVYTAPGATDNGSIDPSSAIAPAMVHILHKLASENQLIVQRTSNNNKQASTVNLNQGRNGSERKGGCC